VRYDVPVDFLCIFVDIPDTEFPKCGDQRAYAFIDGARAFALAIHSPESLS
jgi:hypothetical protein